MKMKIGNIKGPEGKSAYEIAVENGFTGTESEWLDSLNGNSSETGIFLCSHEKTGTEHTLTSVSKDAKILKFTATAPYEDGDTITLNGVSVAAKTQDGEELTGGAWAAGAVVMCLVSPDGGTLFFMGGASNIDELIANINDGIAKKAEVKLLWKNASNTSSFPAQKIMLPIKDYDLLYITYRANTWSGVTGYIVDRTVENKAYAYFVNEGYQTAAYFQTRTAIIADDHIEFNIGTLQYFNENKSSERNDRAIPSAIYGIKGVQ